MLEDDKEWWSFGFGDENSKPDELERQFMENMQYVEHYCRGLGLAKRGVTLAQMIAGLFDRLPANCESAITDDRQALIKDVVSFRNRVAHGKFDTPRPSFDRLLTMTTKLGALLYLNDGFDEAGADHVIDLSKRGSPYLRKMLAISDKPT